MEREINGENGEERALRGGKSEGEERGESDCVLELIKLLPNFKYSV